MLISSSSSSVSASTAGTIVPSICVTASESRLRRSTPSFGIQAVSIPNGPDTSFICPRIISGWLTKYLFMDMPFGSTAVSTHSGISSVTESLFWKKRMSDVTSVPAFALNALFGRRIAPSNSALSARYRLTSGEVLSIVPFEVIKAATPPGLS